ncbi:hypothetical protein Vadar_024293 [Vaccinium darrowii]|uniref:Uncharacterized protein n=1 Tax=Vaccinium darrowii TaxID=229202 RepID=A0ACB7Z5U6_9ERIC|nr:hypothetical protein Vadar_024293 [Vaccinium darrowii]
MAPRIMIYYHKLAFSSHGATKKGDYRATFKIDRPPLPISRVPSNFTPILSAAKATKYECTKAISQKAIQLVCKNCKTVTKKSTKILTNKANMGKVGILKPAMKAVSQPYPHRILIGSIPIELPTTVSVMATSIKKEENVSTTALEDKVMLTPKRAEINTNSTKLMGIESISMSAESKNASTQFVSTTVSRSQNKKSLKNKRGTEKPKVWDTPEAAMYPPSAYYVEKSQNAKSDLEKKKWAFMSGYLLAKEALYGKGAPCKPTNNESPYTSSIAWSETHLMSRPLTKDLTPTNEGSDHSKDSSPSSKNDISQSIPNCSSNQVQFTLTLQDSSTSSSQRKQYEDSHCEDMPVLVTNAIGLEEQLHEMQQKLAEKDAKIAALKTQIANQTSASSVPETQVDLRKLIDIAIHMGTAEPQTFDELVSKASNVKRQISRQNNSGQKTKIFHNESTKMLEQKGESLAIFVHWRKKGNCSNRDKKAKRRSSLKEKKDAKYSFHDGDVEAIFKELLKEKAIILPKPKRPFEVNKTTNPKYCQYHRIVSHPMKECYVLKNIIQKIIKDGDIVLEESSPSEECAATSNFVSVCGGKDSPSPIVSVSPCYMVTTEESDAQNVSKSIWRFGRRLQSPQRNFPCCSEASVNQPAKKPLKAKLSHYGKRMAKSIPPNLVIKTTFKDDGSHERHVFLERKFMPPSPLASPSNLKPRKNKFRFKKGKKNAFLHKVNEKLSSAYLEPMVSTGQERAMIADNEEQNRPRVSIFERLKSFPNPKSSNYKKKKIWIRKNQMHSNVEVNREKETQVDEIMEEFVPKSTKKFRG